MLLSGSNLFCLILFAVPLLAQPAYSVLPTAPAVDGLIKLDVVITDKSEKPISGLASSDVTLLDNGQPKKILSFQGFDGITAKPGTPVEVILVIDAVNLSQEQVAAAKSSVKKLLRANQGHLHNRCKSFCFRLQSSRRRARLLPMGTLWPIKLPAEPACPSPGQRWC